MKFYVLLDNIKFFAYHGVFEQENRVGNYFILHLKVEINNHNSLSTDYLEDTISYADIYDIVQQEIHITSKLLEHVAWRIIKHLKDKYASITTIELKITKQLPPIDGFIGNASVLLID